MYKVALAFPSLLLLPVVLLLLLMVAPVLYGAGASLAANELSFLVLSQPAKFNAARARSLRFSIAEQLRKEPSQETEPNEPDNVFLSHELFPGHDGAWAITPILRHVRAALLKATHRTARWLIVCEEQSHVNVSLLASHLAKEDYREKLFLGYPLYDREATIIHHFAFFKNPSGFRYPYVRAGVALTVPLVDHLVELISDAAPSPGPALSDFSIDVAHEFALLVWRQGAGYPLQPRRYFCANPAPDCAIQVVSAADAEPDCTHKPTTVGQIMFAVKTCHKYHGDRIPVLKRTWTRFVQHLRYFSDVADPSIPTVMTTVPNTSAGHCAKTLEILQLIGDEMRFNGSLQAIQWVMLVDDDTILSPSALARFLSCYDPDRDLYLGERYGYHLMGTDGYSYVTGGGGIVLSVAILDALQQTCECPAPSSPDDMILAACLQRLGVRPIHSALFHQARPTDYAPELLDPRRTVSFHKHWQIDPHQVYNRWFRQSDEQYHSASAGSEASWIYRRESYPLHPAPPITSNRNEQNDSIREHRERDSGDNDDKPSSVRQPSNPHGSQPHHPARASVSSAPDRNVPVAGFTDAPQHIVRPHWCASNELQSNGEALLLRQQNLPESANIIKHTDL